ncbi:restriction endonuclease subunit S [Enterococcus faecalis]|uniref:restriction endonuclease subunit S n=2 Tax=Enterococcus faecalis TaxID=1351 RepID=UPI001787782D|nr:restriction endonuclease subunit S [Enterococcus faecalis]EGO2658228.1 restriction endonuclease subunit S [Enterococcus faecalis]EGO2827896.1 restriction endonuclease subunit S [Enterococcus faecalis]EGO6524995.1 restriction endonuclease subunit S [Enterococcus faecalis]EGO6761853.1 restriction endonuclease subunit S [Enterococcus faecalis]EGO7909022.1 restriction endonuclease subunit S [Enterococcus faecalis]
MKKEQKNSPNLRFKGFTEDWELCKLGDVFEQTSTLIDPKKDRLELWSLTVENGLTPKTQRYNREFLVKKNDQFKAVHSNEFLYNPMNMTLGAVDLNTTGQAVAVSGYYITMQTKENFSSKYFNIWLKTPLAIKNYKLYATGSLIERQRIQFPTLIQIKAYTPQIIEQEKIGDFFQKFDAIITLHQRKLDQLKELKKAYLQVIFPVKDERVPKLRFADFEEEWELCKLGDLANIVGGGTPNTNNPKCWDGNIDWYAPAEIKEKIYVTGSKKRITELGLQKSSAKVLPIGTVLFTSRAGIGNTAILAKKGTTNQGFQSIIPNKNKLDTYFIFSRTHELKKYGEAVGAGSTFVEVSGKQMAKMPMLTPRFNEQQAIGMFFKKIDDIITLHQNKLEQLKDLKTSYLQNMFI